MPQLDKVTFFSQFFWLAIFFFTLYIFNFKYFLPKMSRVLKLRKKMVNQSVNSLAQQENEKVHAGVARVVEGFISNSQNVFKTTFQNNQNWLQQYTNSVSRTRFKGAESKYLNSIAKNSMLNNLVVTTAGSNVYSSQQPFFNTCIRSIAGLRTVRASTSNTKSSTIGTTPSVKSKRKLNSKVSDQFNSTQGQVSTATVKSSSNQTEKQEAKPQSNLKAKVKAKQTK